MKKILITGVNSYIGTSFQRWVSQYPDKYSVEAISVRDDSWKNRSFLGYDVIFHTAAIVHVNERDTSKYFKVNRDLTLDIAKKAKEEGVKQFIFLSTMGVYGIETGYITKETIPNPKTPYAQSKYEAEKLLLEISSDEFKVSIVRPPLVYGRDCPGNYRRLANLALKLPLFPDIRNKRSMIFIDNLSEFIRILIDLNVNGIFFPQNKEYVNTTKLVRLIVKAHGRKIIISKFFNWAVSIGFRFSSSIRKVFGSYVYDNEIPGSPGAPIDGVSIDYEVKSFERSILYTEGRE